MAEVSNGSSTRPPATCATTASPIRDGSPARGSRSFRFFRSTGCCDQPVGEGSRRSIVAIDIPRPVLKNAKALVIGIANDSSIAYGCAKAFRELGADLAITYLNDKSKKFVEPLATELGASIFM